MFTKKAGKPFAKLNFEEFTGQTEVWFGVRFSLSQLKSFKLVK